MAVRKEAKMASLSFKIDRIMTTANPTEGGKTMKRLSLLLVTAVLVSFVATCAAPTPEVIEEVLVTVEVEKEVVKTVEVEKEVVVEKVVTATPAPEIVEIRWLEWWDPEYGEEVMDELIAGFEKTHPNIKVERTAVPWGNMYDNLVTNAQAKTSTYDVVGMEWIWVAGLDKLGALEDLNPWLERADEDWLANRAPGTNLQWRGETLQINWYIMPYQIAYNVDMLAEAGIEPPTSWDEFVEAARALRNEEADTYGFSISLGQNNTAVYGYLGYRLVQLGGTFFDEDGNAIFNSPEGVTTLQGWKDFYDEGLAVPGAPAETHATTREYFAIGKTAMIWDGPFIGAIAKQTNPDIKVAYCPAWWEVTGGYVWAGSGLAMSANSQHKEEAWEFLQYLLSEEVALMMTEKTSIPFATNGAIDSLGESEDPILREIPAMLNQDAEHNYVISIVPEYETTHDALMKAMQEVFLGEKEAKEALDEAAELWNKILAEYR
jgi:multiple sugar transport system substrate-binding protein